MTIPLYQVDAFTSKLFGGNPAAVCPLEAWPDNELLQNIAAENNLSETAYIIPRDDYWDIRWFTPTFEIDLAGHPTLAAAWVIFNLLTSEGAGDDIRFRTRQAGDLLVRRKDGRIVMDFPSRPGEARTVSDEIVSALGCRPEAAFKSRDWLMVFSNEASVRSYRPDPFSLKTIADEKNGVIITAPGEEADFVSRFFAPSLGINEDPVTGSAHCTLVPYWSERLKKKRLYARQISERVGELYLADNGERVEIAGEAVLFMKGSIEINT
ncbi:MAG: PhzF family phenazine biosynthesis protein [Spirochaetaceae bacterium]|nr:PhzF family phenazine biosynthesis protein [Spirochaetaceae bacterium]